MAPLNITDEGSGVHLMVTPGEGSATLTLLRTTPEAWQGVAIDLDGDRLLELYQAIKPILEASQLARAKAALDAPEAAPRHRTRRSHVDSRWVDTVHREDCGRCGDAPPSTAGEIRAAMAKLVEDRDATPVRFCGVCKPLGPNSRGYGDSLLHVAWPGVADKVKENLINDIVRRLEQDA